MINSSMTKQIFLALDQNMRDRVIFNLAHASIDQKLDVCDYIDCQIDVDNLDSDRLWIYCNKRPHEITEQFLNRLSTVHTVLLWCDYDNVSDLISATQLVCRINTTSELKMLCHYKKFTDSVIDWHYLNVQSQYLLLSYWPEFIHQFPNELLLKLPDNVVIDLLCQFPDLHQFFTARLQQSLSVEYFTSNTISIRKNIELLFPYFNWNSISPNDWINRFQPISAIRSFCPYKGFAFNAKILMHKLKGVI